MDASYNARLERLLQSSERIGNLEFSECCTTEADKRQKGGKNNKRHSATSSSGSDGDIDYLFTAKNGKKYQKGGVHDSSTDRRKKGQRGGNDYDFEETHKGRPHDGYEEKPKKNQRGGDHYDGYEEKPKRNQRGGAYYDDDSEGEKTDDISYLFTDKNKKRGQQGGKKSSEFKKTTTKVKSQSPGSKTKKESHRTDADIRSFENKKELESFENTLKQAVTYGTRINQLDGERKRMHGGANGKKRNVQDDDDFLNEHDAQDYDIDVEDTLSDEEEDGTGSESATSESESEDQDGGARHKKPAARGGKRGLNPAMKLGQDIAKKLKERGMMEKHGLTYINLISISKHIREAAQREVKSDDPKKIADKALEIASGNVDEYITIFKKEPKKAKKPRKPKKKATAAS